MPRPCKQVSGELVVYVHGLGGSATNFTDLAGLVATRVAGLAVDLPGFGRSEPERGFDYRLQSHATALGDFLAGLDPGPLHLVGNSAPGTGAHPHVDLPGDARPPDRSAADVRPPLRPGVPAVGRRPGAPGDRADESGPAD
jgi:hypothetical protein